MNVSFSLLRFYIVKDCGHFRINIAPVVVAKFGVIVAYLEAAFAVVEDIVNMTYGG